MSVDDRTPEAPADSLEELFWQLQGPIERHRELLLAERERLAIQVQEVEAKLRKLDGVQRALGAERDKETPPPRRRAASATIGASGRPLPAAWRFEKALEWAVGRTEPFTVKAMSEALGWEKQTVAAILAELRSHSQIRLVGSEPSPGAPRLYLHTAQAEAVGKLEVEDLSYEEREIGVEVEA